MKNTIKLFGLIAMVAIIGLSTAVSGCATNGGNDAGEDITITVTGDFSEYSGYKAYITLDDGNIVAWAMPLNVGASTASLPFTMLRMDNDKPFNKPGSYMVIFWFRKDDDKSTDVNFVIMSRRFTEGNNSIELSSFSEV